MDAKKTPQETTANAIGPDHDHNGAARADHLKPHRFTPGGPGGPGRPKGSVKSTVKGFQKAMADAVSPEQLVSIILKLIELAQGGNVKAAQLVLDRVLGKQPQGIYDAAGAHRGKLDTLDDLAREALQIGTHCLVVMPPAVQAKAREVALAAGQPDPLHGMAPGSPDLPRLLMRGAPRRATAGDALTVAEVSPHKAEPESIVAEEANEKTGEDDDCDSCDPIFG